MARSLSGIALSLVAFRPVACCAVAFGAAAFCAVALLWSSGAQAQVTHVALTALEGRGARVVRRAIARELEGAGLTVTLSDATPGDDVAATAAVAQQAGAGAVIGGQASARGPRWTVALWVRDAAGANETSVAMRVRGTSRREVGRMARRIQNALVRLGSSASPAAESAQAPPAPEPPDGEPEEVHATEPAQSASLFAQAATPDPAPSASPPHAVSDEGGPEASASEEAFSPPVLVWAQIGAGMRSRGVEILSPDGVDSAYRVEPYIELAARFGARFFDVLFLRGNLGSSVGLTSRRETAALGNVDTWFFRARGELGASYWIDGWLELGASVGLGLDRYQMAFNELVPTAEYPHVRPAVLTGIRVIGTALVIDAEVGIRFPFGVGDLQSIHGVDWDVGGVDGLMRLHGVIDPGFTWALEGGFRHYWLSFARPGGGATGADHGWHATAYVGWQLDVLGLSGS